MTIQVTNNPIADAATDATALELAEIRESLGVGPQITTDQTTAGATGPVAATAAGALLLPNGKTAASPAERSKIVRIGTFGNSLAVVASAYAAANLNPMVAAMPGGATINQYTTDLFALGLLYPQARAVAQGGIAGETITQMLARDTLTASATRYATADVLAQSPDVVLLDLPTNDLASVTSGTYTTVMNTAKAAASALIGRLLASNARVYDYGCPGYSTANANLALIQQAVIEWNAWCRTTLTATFGPAGYRFLDPLDVTHDATGAYLPSMSYDGTHLGGWGQYRRAQLAAAELTVQFGQPAKGVFDGNYIANASMAAQVANAWGVQATGFTITAANGTKSNSQVSVINGVAAQSIEVRGLADWQVVSIAIPCDLTAAAVGMTANTALTADEFAQLECDVFIETLSAAPVAFQTIDATIILTGASGGQIYIQAPLGQTVTTAGTTRVALHLATPDVVALGQGGFVSSSARVNFYAATACPDIRVGISGARVTKARRPGVSGFGIVPITSNVTINAVNANTYNGQTLTWDAAYTVTLSSGLPAGFGFAGRPPASGNASVAVSGGPTIDGATTTITRALASNKLFALQGIAADTYTATGS